MHVRMYMQTRMLVDVESPQIRSSSDDQLVVSFGTIVMNRAYIA